MGYRVTRVTAHYKGCTFLKLNNRQYIDEFLSIPLWITGLQGLQHISRVTIFENQNTTQAGTNWALQFTIEIGLA